ncbi:hypothetical protein D3C78_963760 [compost metagenome]
MQQQNNYCKHHASHRIIVDLFYGILRAKDNWSFNASLEWTVIVGYLDENVERGDPFRKIGYAIHSIIRAVTI